MDYEELVAKVIELLQREKRVPYRVLKRRFDMDDDYIEDLKIDLIEAKRLAVDENDRILVWVGDAQAVTSQVAQPTPQPAVQEQPSSQVAPLPTAPPPDAERRQLTVMFCDLVESTKLASQLDPEDLREVVRAYQHSCSEVIQRYEGHIAQLLGDGLLVYFGYPVAHEDDAHRAAHTSLGILDAMRDLNQGLQQAKSLQLGIRIGIHTGLVVVGDMGGAGRQEQLALGETPNIAARIQGLAEPNTVVISDATAHLVQGYFDCQDLGTHTLRGVAEPVAVSRVLHASGARGRLDAAVTRGLTPLVGRESEVTLLLQRWEQAKAGQGQVVLLSGDAGIGKSRLVQMLKDHVTNEPHIRWECRSSPYFENTAFFPLTDLFQRLFQFQAADTPDTKFEKLAQELRQYRLPLEESVPLFAPLLALPLPEDRYPPLALSPQRQRQKTLETLVAVLLELAEHQPVLFILEDLHWTDPTTLELLNLLIDQTPTASLCTVLTCRPTFQPPWSHRSYLTEITVNRLSHIQVEQIVTRMTEGKTFPPEVRAQIVERTDGVPLFVEELTKAVVESGYLKDVNGHYALTGAFSTFTIPATLQDSLMARLDRLVSAKGIAQLAAVMGRQFAYALLHAVSQLDALTLQRELGRLVEAELLYQRGVPPQATYTFKHALIQDAAYQSLLKSTRQQYHQRIAQVLEGQFPDTVATRPELLAHHYTEAGLAEPAIGYWQRAGLHANARSAHVEALSHLTQGLALLATLPETPARSQQELDLQMGLGVALFATKGFAALEVEQTYARARILCAQVGETPQLFPVLRGLCRFYYNRGPLRTARDLGDQLLRLAQRAAEPTHLLEAHSALGVALWRLGDHGAALTHCTQGMALTDLTQQRAQRASHALADGVVCLFTAAHVLWFLGFPAQAVQRSQEGLALAQALEHPLSLATAQGQAAILHSRRRDVPVVQAQADALLTLATAQGFPQWVGSGIFWRGYALAMQGQGEAGLAQMHQGLAATVATGQELTRAEYLLTLAEVAGSIGHVAEGQHLLAQALPLFEAVERGDMLPEAYRLQGALLLQQANPEAARAEACFQQALALARRQQAKSWELRSAVSLSRLWQQQGKQGAAYDLLAPIYGWFTEGFDTADLQDAKALLHELEDGR